MEECQSKENPGRTLPNEALIYCIEACYFSISWGLYFVENQCESNNVVMVSAELRDNLVKYMAACFELTRDGPTEQIQESVGYFLLVYHVLIFINVFIIFASN